MTGDLTVARVVLVADAVGDESALTPAERARRDRLVRDEDRAAYVAAHLLVRACVGELLGLDPGGVVIAQRCADCGGEGHGAPSVVGRPGVFVSLSHARGLVAAVAAHRPCGIDVEPVPESFPLSVLSGRERAWVAAQPAPAAAFTRLWVRKEALAKAGAGRMADASALDVLDRGVPAALVGEHRLTESGLPGAYAALAERAS